MKKLTLLLGFVLILIIFVAGCKDIDLSKLSKEDVNKLIVCEKPYMRYAAECCLDQNDNQICDSDEGLGSSQIQTPSSPSTSTSAIPTSTSQTSSQSTASETKPQTQKSTLSLDLSDYPKPFIVDGSYDQSTTLVVGANAPASDTLSANDIASGLQYESKTCVTTEQGQGQTCTVAKITIDTKSSSEITTPSNYNLILIGSPCVNPLVELVSGDKCSNWNLKSGEALVKLVANGDKVALIVAGTDTADTRRVAKIVRDYKDYKEIFKGEQIIIKSDVLSKVVLG